TLGPYHIHNAHYQDNCAIPRDASLNTEVGLNICGASSLAGWYEIGSPPYGPIQLKNVDGFCLEVNNNSHASGARIDQFTCDAVGTHGECVPKQIFPRGGALVFYGWTQHKGINTTPPLSLDPLLGAGSLLPQSPCDKNYGRM